MQLIKRLKDYDFDKDGSVTEEEKERANQLLELELREEKAEAHKRMSWVVLAVMVLVTALLLTPIIPDSRVQALSDLLGMFYIACASVIGFYFGSTTWLSISK